MSDIDFQNGFLCGMATKGLVRSGELYQPTLYNDSGVFTYFYMNFRRALKVFSLGMFNESILIYDTNRLTVSKVELVSTGLYKVYCDISAAINGVTIINKKTSIMYFSTGLQLPVFSTHFYVTGLQSYVKLPYLYETPSYQDSFSPGASQTEEAAVGLMSYITGGSVSETAQFAIPYYENITETVSVSLT